jgi:hypothetical protein
MPYAGTFMPHPASGYAPMPFNYTNEPSVYGFAQEEQARSTSGNVSLVVLLFREILNFALKVEAVGLTEQLA